MTENYFLMKFEADSIKAAQKIGISSSHEIDQKLTFTFDLDLYDFVWLLTGPKYVCSSIMMKFGRKTKK